MKKFFLLGFKKDQINLISNKFKKHQFFFKENNFNNEVSGCDAIIAITREKIDTCISKLDFSKLPQIKWIHLPGAGMDKYYFLKKTKNINFTSGKIIQGIEVADHAMALLLSITRNVFFVAKFGLSKKFISRPVELRGKKALILGYGGIGRCLAERAFAFGMKIKVVNYNYAPYSNAVSKFYLSEDLGKAISDTDILFITSPLKGDTKKIINDKIIKKLNQNSIIINVSRGEILCTKSLIKYLRSGHLKACGLDVTHPEPLPKNHPLNKMHNVVITPHIAGISDNLSKRTMELILNNIRRFVHKKKLINQVDLDLEI
jgi:phosphoglycerate dehydrogenase-like enzyme